MNDEAAATSDIDERTSDDDDVDAFEAELVDDAATPTRSAPRSCARPLPASRERDKAGPLARYDPLQAYMRDVQRHPLLTPDEEHEAAVKYYEHGDVDAAATLVTANLRLVVKIAYEYRRAYKNIMDLIQEGNIGLMQAVKRYDPYKGVKLSTYAAWWIRAYILRFILNNWRLVKLGTTQAQRKLFFNLQEGARAAVGDGHRADAREIAKRLDVPTDEVVEMDRRLSCRRDVARRAGGRRGRRRAEPRSTCWPRHSGPRRRRAGRRARSSSHRARQAPRVRRDARRARTRASSTSACSPRSRARCRSSATSSASAASACASSRSACRCKLKELPRQRARRRRDRELAGVADPTHAPRGRLSIVATPIGNLDDITLRALATLRAADADPGRGHAPDAQAAHAPRHLERAARAARALERARDRALRARSCAEGKHLALVTDAGTPLVSDPGAQLVRARARRRAARSRAFPGASAVIAALSVCGVAVRRVSLRRLPAAHAARRRDEWLDAHRRATRARACSSSRRRASPRRSPSSPQRCTPERALAVCRELTKLHEEVVRGTARRARAALRGRRARRDHGGGGRGRDRSRAPRQSRRRADARRAHRGAARRRRVGARRGAAARRASSACRAATCTRARASWRRSPRAPIVPARTPMTRTARSPSPTGPASARRRGESAGPARRSPGRYAGFDDAGGARALARVVVRPATPPRLQAGAPVIKCEVSQNSPRPSAKRT